MRGSLRVAWRERPNSPLAAMAIAIPLATVTLGLLALAWVLAALNGDLNLVASQFTVDLIGPLVFLPVALVVATRRRGNPIGWLLLATCFIGALHGAGGEYALRGLLLPHGIAGFQWAAWVSNWDITLVFPAGTFLFVLLLFPTGRLAGRRWRILGVVAALDATLQVLAAILGDFPITLAPNVRPLANPTAVPALSPVIDWLWPVWLGGLLLHPPRRPERRAPLPEGWRRRAAPDQVVRVRGRGDARRRCRGDGRRGTFLNPNTSYNSPATTIVEGIGIGLLMPVALAIAILKYRLYDIDVVISRTLVYGSLAALITGVYVAIAVGLGELVGSGGKPNLGLSILATAIVAVGFQPVRGRAQRVANRLVYGKRATPYEVLSEFSSRVAKTYAGEEVLARMAQVLSEGTGAEAATVWLRSGGQLHPAATHPAERARLGALPMPDGAVPEVPGAARVVVVRHQDEVLGALSIVKRRGEALTPLEEKLLSDLAHQAGLVLKNVGLTGDLQARLEELRQSRQRLVSAQDEERRRLERNLHDGAQQHLVALKVKLGLAEMLLTRDIEKAKATLTQLKTDADEALETLRDLARGIYPPLLADKGLAAAQESQARKATLPVTVEADGLGRYPPRGRGDGVLLRPGGPPERAEVRRASEVRVRLREEGGGNCTSRSRMTVVASTRRR